MNTLELQEKLKAFILRLFGNSTGAKKIELSSRNRRLKIQIAKLTAVSNLADDNKKLEKEIEDLKKKIEGLETW